MPKLLSLVILFAAAFPAWSAAPRISSEDLRKAQLLKEQNLVILDARSAGDFAASHIQGSRNAPLGEIRGDLPKDGRVVVYCPETSCSLAETTAQKLHGLGYANVLVLDGGLAEWTRKGFPVTDANTPAPAKPKPQRLSAQDARDKLSTLFVLDVRPALEFSAGRLPGARNVPLEGLAAELNILPKDKAVLVYDRQAARSRKAAETLLENGFRVYELSGGLAGWARKKYTLEVK